MPSDDEVLRAVRSLAHAAGIPPTTREIAASLDCPESTVRLRLNRLRKAGTVVWTPGKRRTLRVANAKGRSVPFD